jgi:proteasome activator subunit 4
VSRSLTLKLLQRLRFISIYSDVYVDKVQSGFVTWTADIKAYAKVEEGASPIIWESKSQATLDSLAEILNDGEFFQKLIALWAQESSRNDAIPELRDDHVQFIKSIG